MACYVLSLLVLFFFNDTATTEIYTLSLHDALPISRRRSGCAMRASVGLARRAACRAAGADRSRQCRREAEVPHRSEEHASELQSPVHLVCRLLLEKKKNIKLTTLLIMTTTSVVRVS